MIFKRFFGRNEARETVLNVYRTLVAQGRSPQFYRNARVPDTLDGRFDMLVLHVFLVLFRLKAEGEAGKAFGTELLNIMFEDMDESLREIGIGDLSVGKKIKTMASAFYGRVEAYDAGLAAGDRQELVAAIRRNIFPDSENSTYGRFEDGAEMIADYARDTVALLSKIPFGDIMEGRFRFAPLPATAS